MSIQSSNRGTVTREWGHREGKRATPSSAVTCIFTKEIRVHFTHNPHWNSTFRTHGLDRPKVLASAYIWGVLPQPASAALTLNGSNSSCAGPMRVKESTPHSYSGLQEDVKQSRNHIHGLDEQKCKWYNKSTHVYNCVVCIAFRNYEVTHLNPVGCGGNSFCWHLFSVCVCVRCTHMSQT
jgi:hypothetical protein